MGDSSETIFQGQLFVRDCTCTKPECQELELEIKPFIGAAQMVRLPVTDAKNFRWFLDHWIASKEKTT